MTDPTHFLVATDPPHGSVDHEEAAAVLRLSVQDVIAKVRFPAPEVLAVSDQQSAEATARALSDAGMSVKAFDGTHLAEIPWPSPASSVDFDDDGLTFRRGGAEERILYDTPVVGVSCKPPTGFTPPRPTGIDEQALPDDPGFVLTEPLEWVDHLDLYFRREGILQRIAIVEDVDATVGRCTERFEALTMDRRMEGVRPRQRFIAGESSFDLDMRKAFSFGTLLLRQVLDAVSHELRDLTQYEYASRLAYVLARTPEVKTTR